MKQRSMYSKLLLEPTSKLFLKSYKHNTIDIFSELIDTMSNFVLTLLSLFYLESKLTWVKIKNFTHVSAGEHVFR